MTPTELKIRLEQFGISPKRSLGQNFLVSDAVIERILERAISLNPKNVVEIGPGVGALTDGLFQAFQDGLHLIELDSKIAQHWRERGLGVTEGDALKTSWSDLQLDPKTTILVSNLPYQISAPLVMELSALQPLPFSHLILMFQKEVAERIMAAPKNKNYGIISVVAQNAWRITKLVDASARCFYPVPKVSSRVLNFEVKTDLYASRSFLKFVKVGFQNRRKLLVKSLSALPLPEGRSWASILKELGFGDNVRAEELDPNQWKMLHQTHLKILGKL